MKHNARTCVFNPESSAYIHGDKFGLVENLYLEQWGVPKHALWWGCQERAKQAEEAKKIPVVEEPVPVPVPEKSEDEGYIIYVQEDGETWSADAPTKLRLTEKQYEEVCNGLAPRMLEGFYEGDLCAD